jgi:hypothetical protein
MRLPSPDEFIGADWHWRDYVAGCVEKGKWKASAPIPYISRPYHSRLGNLHKFAIVAPIYAPGAGADSPVLGLVACTFATDADLGVRALHDDFRQAVVVALDDPDFQNEPGVKPQHRIIVHKEYQGRPGEKAEQLSPGPLLTHLQNHESGTVMATEGVVTDDNYVDPLSGAGWMAAMTPVPRSPFWIIIQEHTDAAIGLGSIASQLTFTSGIALGIGVLIMSNAIAYGVRRGAWRRA